MLQRGDRAPDAPATDVHGEPFHMSAYAGRVLVLTFFRYASCPMCLLRVAELAECTPWIEAHGGSVVSVFHSPARRIVRHTGRMRLPMRLVADPERRLYAAFGVGRSWWGMGASMLKPSLLVDYARAAMRGHLGGAIDGEFARMPADFVIAPSGKVSAAHYGKTIGDHMPVAVLRAAVEAAGGAAVVHP